MVSDLSWLPRPRHNPYGPSPGQSPPKLSGREREIRQFQTRLGTLIAGGKAPAASFYIAPRGLGKTVLLQEFRKRADLSGCVSAWVTAAPDGALAKKLVADLQRSTKGSRHSGLRSLLELEQISVTVGIPGAAQASVTTRRPDEPSLPFVNALADLAKAVRREGSPGIVIFIDELQEATVEDLRQILPCIQEFAAAPDVPVYFVCAGLTALTMTLARVYGFAERFHYTWLERLDSIASGLALTDIDDGPRWLAAAQDKAVCASKGHPYLIQLIGYHAWEESGASQMALPAILEGDVDIALTLVARDLIRVFETRWGQTNADGRAILAAIANAQSDVVPLERISQSTSIPYDSLERTVRGLNDEGWLRLEGLEDVSLAFPHIEEFVRRNTR